MVEDPRDAVAVVRRGDAVKGRGPAVTVRDPGPCPGSCPRSRVAHGDAKPELLVQDFAKPLRMVEPGVGFKKHPSNYFTHRPIDAAIAHGAAIAALSATDTVKRGGADRTITGTLPRSEIFLAQTPQAFRFDTGAVGFASGQRDLMPA